MKFYIIALIGATIALSSCSKNDGQVSTEANTSKVSSDYPLDVCVVSGEELGSMGNPIKIEHDGTEVFLCCKSCIKKFKRNPAKYVAMLKNGQLPAPSEAHDHGSHSH